MNLATAIDRDRHHSIYKTSNRNLRTVWAPLVVLSVLNNVLSPQALANDSRLMNEYENTCLKFGLNFPALTGAFASSGWSDVTNKPPTEIVDTLRISEEASKNMPKDSGIDAVTVLQKKFPDRTLIAIVSASHLQSKKIVGCQLYDVIGTREEIPSVFPPPIASQTPDRRENKQGLTLTWKNPPALPEIIVVRMGYIAPGTKAASQIGVSGVMMMTTAMSED